MEREVGGGIGMGNTCKPMAVSFQCMTKSTTNKKRKKKIELELINSNLEPQIRNQFQGGSMVKNLPANAGDTGSIPGAGRSHKPLSN